MGVIVQSGRCHDARPRPERFHVSHVGRATRRREDPPLLRGEGRFLDDLPLDDVAHVVFVRSPHAHARLSALDVEAARGAPDVVAVFTSADVDKFPPIGMARAIDGMVVPEMFFLADAVVRSQGTPVAMVVAESAALAHDAAALVRVQWAPLPGAAEADAALAAHAPSIVGRPDNRCFTYAVRAGDTDRAFATAHRIVAVDVRQTRLAGVPLEPRGVAARWADERSPSGRRRKHRIGSVTRLRGCSDWPPRPCA
jgi:aerobic carbon-monoxide dehydrogenase large subunit